MVLTSTRTVNSSMACVGEWHQWYALQSYWISIWLIVNLWTSAFPEENRKQTYPTVLFNWLLYLPMQNFVWSSVPPLFPTILLNHHSNPDWRNHTYLAYCHGSSIELIKINRRKERKERKEEEIKKQKKRKIVWKKRKQNIIFMTLETCTLMSIHEMCSLGSQGVMQEVQGA